MSRPTSNYQTLLLEIKVAVEEIGRRVHSLELREAGCAPLFNARLLAAEGKLLDHEIRMKALEDISHDIRTIKWTGGVAVAAIILWLVNSVLHLIN